MLGSIVSRLASHTQIKKCTKKSEKKKNSENKKLLKIAGAAQEQTDN